MDITSVLWNGQVQWLNLKNVFLIWEKQPSVDLYLVLAPLQVRGAEISGYKPSPNLLNEGQAQPGEPLTVWAAVGMAADPRACSQALDL